MNAYDDNRVVALLNNVTTIAVVGLSPKPSRPSNRVAKQLITFAYTVIPVRPGVQEILGEKAYKSLEDIPFIPDMVNVFRASKYVAGIVDTCIALGVKSIWLQEGISDGAAQERAHNAGISMIMDRCLYKEIVRLGIK